jgi:hypothetical protein
MKKIIIILGFILIGLQGNSQIIQLVSSSLNNIVNVCSDTTEHSDYNCQKMADVDSINLITEYTNFVSMCKILVNGDTLVSYNIQNTKKMTMIPDVERRIGITTTIRLKWFDVSMLTLSQQTIYNNFITKIKDNL